jgi:hypothetical protein
LKTVQKQEAGGVVKTKIKRSLVVLFARATKLRKANCGTRSPNTASLEFRDRQDACPFYFERLKNTPKESWHPAVYAQILLVK